MAVTINASTSSGLVQSADNSGIIQFQSNGVTKATLNSSGFSYPGAVLQVVNTTTGASATGTATIPQDDTIPQNTEGTEFMTLAITPTNATSKLKIDVVVNGAGSGANSWIVGLFQDSTVNAIAAINYNMAANNVSSPASFTYYMTAGTTSSTTFKIRVGCSTAGTFTFNGQSSARLLGGVMASSITITEISA